MTIGGVDMSGGYVVVEFYFRYVDGVSAVDVNDSAFALVLKPVSGRYMVQLGSIDGTSYYYGYTEGNVAPVIDLLEFTFGLPKTTFTVSFVVDGEAYDVVTVAKGAAVVDVPANPVKAGYTFSGWFLGDADVAFDFGTVITGDVVLTAVFAEVESVDALLKSLSISTGFLTPTFVSGIFSYTATVSNDVNSIVVTAVANSGAATVSGAGHKCLSVGENSFSIVVTAEDDSVQTYTVVVTREATSWFDDDDEDLYTVTYRPGLHGMFVVKSVSDLFYGDVTPIAPVVTGEVGWRFVRWDPVLSATVTGDVIYTALWEQVSFTVRFEDWDGTLLKSQEVPYSGSATAPVNPSRNGYTFTGWDCAFINITADITVAAQYQTTSSPSVTAAPSPSPSVTAAPSPSASASYSPAPSASASPSLSVSPSGNDGRSSDDSDNGDGVSSDVWLWVAVGIVIFAVGIMSVIFVLKYKK
ncbi:MAG: InlB B-repeat-containing protein, partial [Nitrososphaerota archaeon]|jgi:uncharacterized repeat protein (TIGR02543 family)|nr:InlB B-repeat-containing protein [Nitrososphaerota archaeon]